MNGLCDRESQLDIVLALAKGFCIKLPAKRITLWFLDENLSDSEL